MRIRLLLLLASAPFMFAETKPPRVRFKVEAEYTKQARKAKLQGLVVLSLIVDTEGNPTHIYVARKLGKGLDEKAVEAVKKWVFFPATRDGTPVPFPVTVDLSFNLEKNPPVKVRMEGPGK